MDYPVLTVQYLKPICWILFFSPVKILHSVNLCKLKEMKQIKGQNKASSIVWQYLR